MGDGLVHRLHFRETQSKVQRKKHNPTPVCFKPLYKTLKKVQVRSGPGSKFEATGVIGANEEVIVIQEGLMQCDLKLVEDEYDQDQEVWTHCEPIETYINQTFDEDEEKIFRKALAAANRKVRVMYKENGTTKYGWISKRKNSGALITRFWGKSTPSIVVSGVDTQPNDT